jgi:hypothetical protein
MADGPVFLDEWKDEEAQRDIAAPRRHPFGLGAWQCQIDGRTAVFRNHDAFLPVDMSHKRHCQ